LGSDGVKFPWQFPRASSRSEIRDSEREDGDKGVRESRAGRESRRGFQIQMLVACDLTTPDSRSFLPRQAPDAPVNSLPVQQDTNPVLLLPAAELGESRDIAILCWPLVAACNKSSHAAL